MQDSRSGLTLVEWLVIIVCVSIVLGLLLMPGVDTPREVSRRTECQVKLKNLALASIQHEMAKAQLPGWADKYGFFEGGVDPSDLAQGDGAVSAHVKVGGYGVALLPWLDAQPTYEHWTDDRYPVIHQGGADAEFKPTEAVGISSAGAGYHPLAAPNLPNFQCPSNPMTDASHGRNSYIVNAGMCYLRSAAAAGGSVTPGLTNTQTDAQRASNGIANARYMPLPTPDGYGIGPKVSLDDIKDGKSYTALYSENVQALPWHLAGFLNGAGPAPNLLPTDPDFPEDLAWDAVNREFLLGQFTAGMVWHFEDPEAAKLNAMSPPVTSPSGLKVATDQFELHKINGGGDDVQQDIFMLQMDKNNCMDLARPSSAHVEGINMSFADGSVRFISETIDYRVYQALLTPDGSESDVPVPSHVLADDALAD